MAKIYALLNAYFKQIYYQVYIQRYEASLKQRTLHTEAYNHSHLIRHYS